MGLFGGDPGKRAALQAEREELERQQRVSQGTIQIRKQFDDTFNVPYYKNIEKNARGVYEPQINEQYQNALRQMSAALMRAGLGSSGIASQMGGELMLQKGLATQDKRAKIQGLINARKGDVANAENITLSQLANTADPFAAQAQAANLIDANRADPGYSPLGQLFTDASAGLATQADLERSNQNRYNWGVTNWLKPNRSVRNVR